MQKREDDKKPSHPESAPAKEKPKPEPIEFTDLTTGIRASIQRLNPQKKVNTSAREGKPPAPR